MKKITLFFTLLLLSSAALQARTVDVSAAYIGASHFDQARVSAVAAWSLNVLAGVEAKYVKENTFKDPVYSVNLPIELDFGYLKLDLKPFYYFKNKSQNESFQDSSAYGVSTRLTSRNSDYIWREIAEGEFAGYKEDAMEEPVIELDFGNGSRLRICAAPDADPDTRSVNVRLEREGEVRSIRVNGVRLLNIERLISVQWGNEAA